MNEYKKELTLTVEELNALGMNFEFTVSSIMNNGCSPERFEIIKKLKERLKKCK